MAFGVSGLSRGGRTIPCFPVKSPGKFVFVGTFIVLVYRVALATPIAIRVVVMSPWSTSSS